MYQKVSNIELGGGYKGNPVNTATHYRAKGTFPIEQGSLNQAKSKEIIVSSHKIPGKVSPGKYKLYSHQTSRHGSVLQNQNSFLQMKDSAISSPVHMVKLKSPLRDASNQSPTNLQSRQFVRVNFISNSPQCSRTSSTHLREFRQSPSKMVTCIAADKDTRNEILERKMRVLQGRIGELHKEKQELMGRLNEENRKIYHQNTVLKLKVNELTKKFEKDGGKVFASNDDKSEIFALQKEKEKLEEAVMLLTQNNNKLGQQNQLLKNQLHECTDVIKELSANLQKIKEPEILSQKLKQLQQENQHIIQSYHQKQSDYDSLHSQYLQLSEEKLELLSIKEKYQHDLNEIRQSINENNANQDLIIREYEGKLDEYKQAYDKNQEIIEQLSLQLQESQQYSSQDIYPNSYDEVVGQSEGELAIQCKNLENNFLMALDQKDRMIATLQESKVAMENALISKDQMINELSANNSEQSCKLQEIGTILERYTQKMKDMESKYEQLYQKHEQEKQRTNKADSSAISEKCRKCQELTKTIFRLNSHLNKRT